MEAQNCPFHNTLSYFNMVSSRRWGWKSLRLDDLHATQLTHSLSKGTNIFLVSLHSMYEMWCAFTYARITAAWELGMTFKYLCYTFTATILPSYKLVPSCSELSSGLYCRVK
jgi:hypothetical protein